MESDAYQIASAFTLDDGVCLGRKDRKYSYLRSKLPPITGFREPALITRAPSASNATDCTKPVVPDHRRGDMIKSRAPHGQGSTWRAILDGGY